MTIPPCTRLLVFAILCSGIGRAAEVREWTDKTSGKKIQASILSADREKAEVTIQTAAGQTFTLKADRLVEADLAYIREFLAKPATPPTPPTPPTTPPAGAPAAPAAKEKAAPLPAGQPAPPPPQVVIIPAKKFKFPAGHQILEAVKKVRPRVFLNAAQLAAVKARSTSDPISAQLLKNVATTGEAWLTKFELQQKRGEGTRGGGVGGEGLHRFLSYGLLDVTSGDPKWKARMPSELEALARFTNWKPDEPEENAEFVVAVSLGYDWFRSALNDQQAKKVRDALVQLGMDALSANLKEAPLPATTKRPEPGQSAEPSKAPPPKKKLAANEKRLVTSDEMVMASALMVAAIAIADEEPNVAAPAANLAAKILGEGLTQFAPEGIWTEGLSRGESVLEAISFLSMTLRAATGTDFDLTRVEGLPAAELARIQLTGPAGVFNYCSFEGTGLNKPWINSWLTMNYGNLGLPAFRPRGAASDQSYGVNQAGLLVYQNPYIAGVTVPEKLDGILPVSQVVSMRSAWHDPKAYYVGFKGGSNALPGSQLDLGTFVLDAGGVRWGTELGVFTAQGKPVNMEDATRFTRYRDNTLGQNVIRFTGAAPEEKAPKKGAPPPPLPHNQSADAKAKMVAFESTPDRGLAIIDLADAYSNRVKEYKRGIMLSRGATPSVLVQDELEIKSTASPEWVMHTKATVTVNGKTATLKQGESVLTATLLAPADASFFSEEVPEPKDVQKEGSFKGIFALKVPMKDVKGKHTVRVVFALGDKTPELPNLPLEAWVAKKR